MSNANSKEPVYIKVFLDDLDALEPFSDAERGRLLTALLEYGRTGETPQLNGNERFLFPMMKARIDRDFAAWREKDESLHEARANAGRKGGQANASKGKHNEANQANASKDKHKTKTNDDDDDHRPLTIDDDDTPPLAPPAGGDGETPESAPAKSGKAGKKPAKPKKPEVPKIAYAEFVTMTEAEHQKLVEQHGEAKTARMIEILDNYKGSKGATYDSDYRAILSWVIKRVEEDDHRQNAYQGGYASNGYGGGQRQNVPYYARGTRENPDGTWSYDPGDTSGSL